MSLSLSLSLLCHCLCHCAKVKRVMSSHHSDQSEE